MGGKKLAEMGREKIKEGKKIRKEIDNIRLEITRVK